MSQLNLAQTSKNIREGIAQIEDISSAITTIPNIPDLAVSTATQMFDSAIKSVFNSPEETNAKKVVAAALIIAKSKGLLPAEMADSLGGVDAAAIADEGVSRLKVGFQTAIGNIDVYEGADILIDKATARALAVSELVVDKVVGVAIDKVSVAIATICPPLAPVAYAMKAFQPFITEKVKEKVDKGINKLSAYAKTLVRKVGETIINKATTKLRELLLA